MHEAPSAVVCTRLTLGVLIQATSQGPLRNWSLLSNTEWQALPLVAFLWPLALIFTIDTIGVSPVVLVVKHPPAIGRYTRDMGLIPGLGRSHGWGHGNPLQYSCLENSMDGGAWWSTVQRVAESDTIGLGLKWGLLSSFYPEIQRREVTCPRSLSKRQADLEPETKCSAFFFLRRKADPREMCVILLTYWPTLSADNAKISTHLMKGECPKILQISKWDHVSEWTSAFPVP